MVGPITLRTAETPLVEWRPGVRTRLHASEAGEPASLCAIGQWCDPGLGAPPHTHFEVEEVIAIVEGNGAARPPVCYAEEPDTILEVGGRSQAMRDPHRDVRAQQGEES
jgi:hypothetical protein